MRPLVEAFLNMFNGAKHPFGPFSSNKCCIRIETEMIWKS